MRRVAIRFSVFRLVLSVLVGLACISMTHADDRFLQRGVDHGNSWISGGIGLSEREDLEARLGADYNLRVEFALPTGNYIAQVGVRIQRGGETVLEVADVGPWLLVRLPEGSYSVQASAQGEQFQAAVRVPASGARTVVFNRWAVR